MFVSEEIEFLLKAELDEAEHQLRNAKPQDKDQARHRFKEALHNFTLLVMDGEVPLALVKRP
jgi:phage gp36-like protein